MVGGIYEERTHFKVRLCLSFEVSKRKSALRTILLSIPLCLDIY